MFCTSCGRAGGTGDEFCASCGHRMPLSQPSSNTSQAPYQFQPNPRPVNSQVSKQGLGFGIASLVLGVVSVCFVLADFGLLSSGDYQYIFYSEIGFLFFLFGWPSFWNHLGSKLKSCWTLGVSSVLASSATGFRTIPVRWLRIYSL